MNSSRQPPWTSPEDESRTRPAASVDENWTQHEHVAASLQSQARGLLDLTGSPEIAKHAIDNVAQVDTSAPIPDSAELTAFASGWGFTSAAEFQQTSTILSSNAGRTWRVTKVGPDAWILWNNVDLRCERTFLTREEAVKGFFLDEASTGKAD